MKIRLMKPIRKEAGSEMRASVRHEMIQESSQKTVHFFRPGKRHFVACVEDLNLGRFHETQRQKSVPQAVQLQDWEVMRALILPPARNHPQDAFAANGRGFEDLQVRFPASKGKALREEFQGKRAEESDEIPASERQKAEGIPPEAERSGDLLSVADRRNPKARVNGDAVFAEDVACKRKNHSAKGKPSNEAAHFRIEL